MTGGFLFKIYFEFGNGLTSNEFTGGEMTSELDFALHSVEVSPEIVISV